MDVCESDALHHSLFPAGQVHTVRRDILPTPESMMELLRARRSNRTLTNCPIPPEMLRDLLEAARYAPTAENTRRVRVTVTRYANWRAWSCDSSCGWPAC